MTDIEQKWNRNFSNTEVKDTPCTLLLENQHLLPKTGSALDLASGLGGNAVRLANLGLTTQAWDISSTAVSKVNGYSIQKSLPLTAVKLNLEHGELPDLKFDVIVVSHYLHRTLCEKLPSLLFPDGLLFYQTFTQLKVKSGGPNNPDFLLQDGELLNLFPTLSTIFYREERVCGNIDLGHRNLAFYIGRN